ncbi:immunity protein Imm33 domain-containing protein [Paenibacillus lignilyticus]
MIASQHSICNRYGAEFLGSDFDEKLGIALNVMGNVVPINGLRYKPENGTCGWYIWAGEGYSDDPDFFVSLHVKHIDEWNPLIRKYLGLGPGWRFLIADKYEDVWFDQSLLD